jgi:hypothetical protein
MSNVTVDPKKVLDALTELGSTSEDVAEALELAGIKGTIGEEEDCPLYHWLDVKIPEANGDISIGGEILRVDGMMFITPHLATLPEEDLEIVGYLPPQIPEFIADFDSYLYTELVTDYDDNDDDDDDEEFELGVVD